MQINAASEASIRNLDLFSDLNSRVHSRVDRNVQNPNSLRTIV